MKSIGLKLAELIDFIGAKKTGPALIEKLNKNVPGLSTDSRAMERGQVFLALKGPRFDGHDHLEEALEKGALAVISQKAKRGPTAERLILVEDSQRALEELASQIRMRQKLMVVAVTGSNGKTGVKEMLGSIFQGRNPLVTAGNFNNRVGLPLTIFRVEKENRLAVLEMGMNHFGEIKRLTEIASPDVGLVTTVAAAHLEYFGTLAKVAQAKGELYANLPLGAVAVVNQGQPLLLREARKFSGPKLSFGFKEGDVRLKGWKSLGLEGQSFTIMGPGLEKGRRLSLSLLGRHNAENALAAAAAALAAGASWDEITEGLSAAKSFPGRLSVLKNKKGHLIIDDSYNANPSSMEAALTILGGLEKIPFKAAILGDMLELGPKAGALHRGIGRQAAELGLDRLLAVGELSKEILKGAVRAGLPKEKAFHFQSPEEAAESLRGLPPKAAVLIKGSNGLKLGLAVKAMLEF